MILLTQYIEHKNGNLSIYEKVVTDDDGNVQYSRKVFIPLYQQEVDGFTYFVMYDDLGGVIHDVYSFLNIDMKSQPYNSRRQAAFSLRLLYCFLSLANCKVDELNSTNFSELMVFLRGLDSNSQLNPMKTLRCANTVNRYLATYRTYFRKYNIPCKDLFSATTITSASFSMESPVQIKTYRNNLRVGTVDDNSPPKYINPDEFGRIYKAILAANDKTAQIICHLMYGYGLRLGEVLGLTTEDIKFVRDNGKDVPAIFLRNRLSDKPFQNAKNLMHVMSKEQYRTKDYQNSKHRIIITKDFYKMLSDYVNDQYEQLEEKYPDVYENNEADIVSVYDIPDFNYYVFLNQYGRVLSAQTWGNHLKKYFEIAGVPTDKDVRDANLSHRFRHGFAMFHANFSKHKVEAITLQKLMRHKSIKSTLVYYNPTPEDEEKIKEGFQADMYDMIPGFKEVLINATS